MTDHNERLSDAELSELERLARRKHILEEDGETFGLVPAEQAEVARANRDLANAAPRLLSAARCLTEVEAERDAARTDNGETLQRALAAGQREQEALAGWSKERERADALAGRVRVLAKALEAHDRYMLDAGYQSPDSDALHPKAAENWRNVRVALQQEAGAAREVAG
jgi:hypothetical protein